MRISDWSSDVCSSDLLADAALDDLVEFAAIEPDPTTLRAIVDLDALPLAHDEIDAACRAQQPLGRTAIYHDGFLLPNIAPSVVGGAARRRRWFDGAPMMPRGLPRQSRLPPQEIGRPSGGERVCTSGEIWGGGVTFKKK